MPITAAALLALSALACLDVGSIQGERPMMDAATDDGPLTCATCASASCSSPTDDNLNLVAGLESGCSDHEVRNGRSTTWFTFSNSASDVTPKALPFVPTCLGAKGSCYAACISGQLAGDSYPFAGMGVALNGYLGQYDLSAYAGISFYVLGSLDPLAALRFGVSTIEVASVGGGGTCTAAEACNDAFSIEVPDFPPGFTQSDWRQVVVTFDTLQQMGWGLKADWNPAHVISLNWNVGSVADTLTTDQLFTVCVDQVELVPR